jgi:hypothetical protein
VHETNAKRPRYDQLSGALLTTFAVDFGCNQSSEYQLGLNTNWLVITITDGSNYGI